MVSTSPIIPPLSRRALLLATAAGAVAVTLAGCGLRLDQPSARPAPPPDTDGAFWMPDGARLPYRAWLPDGEVEVAILALHGFNDSRDAWELPAPDFAAAGMALYAPDQRGFGNAPDRGFWPGTETLVRDAAAMAKLVRDLHPRAKLVLMGESMGGAVLMILATSPLAPKDVSGWVLLAPAVWGRARMNIFLRSGLWLAANLAPGVVVAGGGPITVVASSNREALLRLGRDPLTLHGTRFDTLRGLVDLMDAALSAAPAFRANGLFLYGAKDELVPPEATRATWNALRRRPGGPEVAFYPQGYHLLLRDLDRLAPISDVISWIRDPLAPLPSGADKAAEAWLTERA